MPIERCVLVIVVVFDIGVNKNSTGPLCGSIIHLKIIKI